MKVTPNRQKRCENPATTYPFTPSESKSKRNKPEILDQKKKTKTRHCHHSWYLPEIMLWILKGPQYPPILWPQEWTKKHTTNINQWWSMMFNQCMLNCANPTQNSDVLGTSCRMPWRPWQCKSFISRHAWSSWSNCSCSFDWSCGKSSRFGGKPPPRHFPYVFQPKVGDHDG